MAIRIITDSASDIAPSHPRVTVVPMTVTFGDTEYRDGIDLDANGFYELLVEGDQIPTTSQISPGTFAEAFEEATADGSDVVCVALSSRLSGTYQSACLAAEGFDGKVHVVDSQNVTVGESVLVHRALQLVDEGLSAEEVAGRLNAEKCDVRLVALLDTLEYLRRGGRVSAASAAVGGMLSIKPVVGVVDGDVVVLGKARGSKQSKNMVFQKIDEAGGIDFTRPIWVAYSGLSDATARKYIADSLAQAKAAEEAAADESAVPDDLPLTQVGAVIGAHVGPGGVAFAFFARE